MMAYDRLISRSKVKYRDCNELVKNLENQIK